MESGLPSSMDDEQLAIWEANEKQRIPAADSIIISPDLFTIIKQNLIDKRKEFNEQIVALPQDPVNHDMVRYITVWFDNKLVTWAEMEDQSRQPNAHSDPSFTKKVQVEVRTLIQESLELLVGGMNVATTNIRNANATSRDAKEKIRAAKANASTIHYRNQELKIESIPETLNQKDTQIRELQTLLKQEQIKREEVVQAVVAEKDKLETKREKYIKFLEKQLEDAAKECKDNEEQFAKHKIQEQSMARELTERKTEMERYLETYLGKSHIDKDAKIAELQSRLRDLEREIKDFDTRIDALCSELSHANTQNNKLQAENTSLREEVISVKRYYAEVREELKGLTRDLNEHASNNATPEDKRISSSNTQSNDDSIPLLKQQINSLMSKITRLEKTVEAKEQEIIFMRHAEKSPVLQAVRERRATMYEDLEAVARAETGNENGGLRWWDGAGLVKLLTAAADYIVQLLEQGRKDALRIRELELRRAPQRAWPVAFVVVCGLLLVGAGFLQWQEFQLWREANGLAEERYRAVGLGGVSY